jgi:hypothetical protein
VILTLMVIDRLELFAYYLGEAKMEQAVNTLKKLQGMSRETIDVEQGPKGRIEVVLIPIEHMERFRDDKGLRLPPGSVTVGRVLLYMTGKAFIQHMEAAREQFIEEVHKRLHES